MISPLLSNIYLYYVYDLWAQRWSKDHKTDVLLIRYADDSIAGFASEGLARWFLRQLRDRLACFGLELSVP